MAITNKTGRSIGSLFKKNPAFTGREMGLAILRGFGGPSGYFLADLVEQRNAAGPTDIPEMPPVPSQPVNTPPFMPEPQHEPQHGGTGLVTVPPVATPPVTTPPVTTPPFMPGGERPFIGHQPYAGRQIGWGRWSRPGGSAAPHRAYVLGEQIGWGGWRRLGGPVSPQRAYVVGENGPEVIVPSEPGVVVPNPADMPPPVLNDGNKYSIPATPVPDMPQPTYGQSAEGEQIQMLRGSATANEAMPPQGNEILPPAPLKPDIALTPSERVAKARYNVIQAENAPAPREPKFWNRLGSGILDGLRAWVQAGAPGGVGGALGAIATGGTMFAASPKWQGEYQKWQNVAEQERLYKRALADEAIARQSQAQNLDIKGKQMQIAFQDPVFQKGYLTNADVDYIKQQYGVDVRDPQNPKLTSVNINGQFYAIHPDPSIPGIPLALPAEKTRVPVQVQTPKGSLYVDPKDALGFHLTNQRNQDTAEIQKQKLALQAAQAAELNKYRQNMLKISQARFEFDKTMRQVEVALKQQAAAGKAVATEQQQQEYDLYRQQGDLAKANTDRLQEMINQRLAQGEDATSDEIQNLYKEYYKAGQDVLGFYRRALKALPKQVVPKIPNAELPDTSAPGTTGNQNKESLSPLQRQLQRIPPQIRPTKP